MERPGNVGKALRSGGRRRGRFGSLAGGGACIRRSVPTETAPSPASAAPPERERYTRAHIAALKLSGFRNYAVLSLPLDSRSVVLTGPERRRQDQSPRSRLVSLAGTGHARRRAR